jgi:hypothetical protein
LSNLAAGAEDEPVGGDLLTTAIKSNIIQDISKVLYKNISHQTEQAETKVSFS